MEKPPAPGKIMLLETKKSFQSWQWRLRSKSEPSCILSRCGGSASIPVQAAMRPSRSTLRSLPLFVCLDVLVPIRDVVATQLQRTPLPTRSCETNDLFPRCIVDPCANVAIFIFHNLLYKHLYQNVKLFIQKITWQLRSGVFARRCLCFLTNGQPSGKYPPRAA